MKVASALCGRPSGLLRLEATGGFEPPNRGFADPRLRPLGYVALCVVRLMQGRPGWCRGGDSNSHSQSGHSALNAACLPIPPPRHTLRHDATAYRADSGYYNQVLQNCPIASVNWAVRLHRSTLCRRSETSSPGDVEFGSAARVLYGQSAKSTVAARFGGFSRTIPSRM